VVIVTACVVQPFWSSLVGSTEGKSVLIGVANCLLFDLVLVFVYLLFWIFRTGFLEETALAPCLHSVQHSGILSHAAPVCYRYSSKNKTECSARSSATQTALYHSAPPIFHLSYRSPCERCLELLGACQSSLLPVRQQGALSAYVLVNPRY